MSVSIFNLLTGSSSPLLASGDVVAFVDVSDSTQSAQGSTVKATLTQFFAAIPVPIVVTSASANALAVGRLGSTTPAFTVDSSTGSQVAGLKVTGAVTGGTVAVVVTDSGSNANLSIDAKGSGTITIAGTSTGSVSIPRTISQALGTITADTKNLDASVTWNNAGVTFTGIKLNVTNTASGGSSKLIDLQVGGANRLSLNTTGTLTIAATYLGLGAQFSGTAGFGYIAGAGGTVTQGAGSGKATAVTLNTACGAITMDNAALNNNTTVSFTLNNNNIDTGYIVHAIHSSGGTAGAYDVRVTALASGSCQISVRNESGGSLSEAIVITFVMIRGATS